jgi:hypothetical protein
MKVNDDHRLRTISLPLACGLVLMTFNFARADFLLPNHAHSQKMKNNTGAAANDLHVNLIHVATGKAPTAPPFAPGATGGFGIDFAGGAVPAGGTSTVSWESKFASDTLDPTDPGHWTFNNANIGDVTLASVNLRPQYQDLGGGLVLASIQNTGSPVSYTGLQVFNNANASFFSPSDFVSGLPSGVPVGLLAPANGVFNNGLTQIAQFSPATSPLLYAGGSVEVGGDLFAHASSAAPEPSSLVLLCVALLLASWKHRVRT